MSITAADVPVVVFGNMVTLSTTTGTRDVSTGTVTPASDPGIKLYVRDEDGNETTFDTTSSQPLIQEIGTGSYHLAYLPAKLGLYSWRWEGDAQAQGAAEGQFRVVTDYVLPASPPDLTDLRVLVPRARRYCEGPYGPPENRPPLEDEQLYQMVADACGDIIMATGNLFGHKLVVKERDPRVGFPMAWQTDTVLDEWEGAVIITQTALNYFFFIFRDLKTSQGIKNEGTEWTYSLSVNIIRDYIANLKAQRDMALQGLMKHHPVLDRFASNIRVRDQATVAVLEWWATNIPDQTPGLPGGQEAAVIPWTPGWSGPGFTP